MQVFQIFSKMIGSIPGAIIAPNFECLDSGEQREDKTSIIELMDVNEFANAINRTFIEYWKRTRYPVEITTRWCIDLAMELFREKHEHSKDGLQTLIDKSWNDSHTFEEMSQLIMAVNYLNWFCALHDDYKEYKEIFSDNYYSLYEMASHKMSEDEFFKLYQILD